MESEINALHFNIMIRISGKAKHEMQVNIDVISIYFSDHDAIKFKLF